MMLGMAWLSRAEHTLRFEVCCSSYQEPVLCFQVDNSDGSKKKLHAVVHGDALRVYYDGACYITDPVAEVYTGMHEKYTLHGPHHTYESLQKVFESLQKVFARAARTHPIIGGGLIGYVRDFTVDEDRATFTLIMQTRAYDSRQIMTHRFCATRLTTDTGIGLLESTRRLGALALVD